MMSKKETGAKTVTGCLGAFWGLLVVLPMWLFLTSQILVASNVDPWVWGLFYGYVPASFFGAVLQTLYKSLD